MVHINRIILLLLIALFLFSGIDKLLHYNGFVNALRNYALVPVGSAALIAMPVILAELLTGIGLLMAPWRAPAALVAASLLGVFTIAVATNYFVGEKGICGCWFTLTLNQGTGAHIAQNLLLLGLALMVFHDARSPGAPPTVEGSPVGETAG